MAVKLRLQRKGRKKAPFYHIVAADSRSPRDGKFIEKIGTYNPMTKPATIEIDRTAAFDWLMKGAQPTDTVRAILRFKGVMYRKHLQRGVNKGALTEEKAHDLYETWVHNKEAHISARFEQTKLEALEFHKSVFGVPKVKPEPEVIEETVVEAAPEAAAEEATSTEEGSTEENAENTEA
ncbi:MAG: 30S ribosomal protein S16 [Saprospiraceae bacterium]|nr:30S ribosomal protein S16 [Saprospiraceae bacterium]